MGPIDALIHLLNFFAPALGVGLLASLLVKLFWRRALATVPMRRLLPWSVGAGAISSLVGLVLFGSDGAMATYAMLVLACASGLWWAGFARRSR